MKAVRNRRLRDQSALMGCIEAITSDAETTLEQTLPRLNPL